MKRYRLYILTLGLLLGMLLTACQTEALPGEQTRGGSETVGMPDTCYINLHIVNNSQPATRAVVAATAKENAIYDGILCILEGEDAASAKLKTATVIDQLILNPGTEGSSVDVQVTQRLATGTHAYNSNLYVLALLNTSSTGLYAKGGRLYKRNTSGTDTDLTNSNSTISNLQALQIDSVGNTNEHVGLFMANKGGVLPQVTSTYLFDTPEQAKTAEGTRLTIEVERAAAKVKLSNDIPAGTALSNITLVGATQTHPLIHKMKWMLKQYNSGAFAVGGGATATAVPSNGFAAKDFTYFHQHALESDDAVYVGPNNSSTKTQVVVEVQLKDGSFLLGDCFVFSAWDNNKLFTNVEALKDYYKSGWESQKSGYPAISDKSADAVFRNLKVVINANDQVEVTLTNSDFTADEQTALNNLAATLNTYTTYFRDGKMYYTYTLGDLARNNAYNLSLVEEAATDTRQVTATFKFDQGSSNTTATFSNGTASLFSNSGSVTLGGNLTIQGTDASIGQTKIQPEVQHYVGDANETDYIEFMIDPVDGWTFTPTSVSFNTTRYGTDGGLLDISWVNSGGASTVSLATKVNPQRNNATPNVTNWSSTVTGATPGEGSCGLRIKLYSLGNNKQVGFSDITINGTLSQDSGISSPQKSISGVGRAAP